MKALITATTVQVTCPKCKEPLPEPGSGSFQWETNQVFAAIMCSCGTPVTVVIPKTVRVA
jgi:RNase P subunit RPR2